MLILEPLRWPWNYQTTNTFQFFRKILRIYNGVFLETIKIWTFKLIKVLLENNFYSNEIEGRQYSVSKFIKPLELHMFVCGYKIKIFQFWHMNLNFDIYIYRNKILIRLTNFTRWIFLIRSTSQRLTSSISNSVHHKYLWQIFPTSL